MLNDLCPIFEMSNIYNRVNSKDAVSFGQAGFSIIWVIHI